eukprot:2903909-Rhodomonas_salina.1
MPAGLSGSNISSTWPKDWGRWFGSCAQHACGARNQRQENAFPVPIVPGMRCRATRDMRLQTEAMVVVVWETWGARKLARSLSGRERARERD